MLGRTAPFLVVALALAFAAPARAWWNEEWSFRKELTLDTTAEGAQVPAGLAEVPVLVRLHSGNFGYFLDLQESGADLRFVAGDDTTPLKYHIERLDSINELGFVWVKLSELPASGTSKVWMYYGNPQAPPGGEPEGSFDTNTALVYHFSESGAPDDATAYGNDPEAFTAEPQSASLIAAGARLGDGGRIVIPDAPSLALDPQAGWTFSAWVRIQEPQSQGYLLERRGNGASLSLVVDGTSLVARYGAGGQAAQTPATNLAPGEWHHVALVAGSGRLALYLDGQQAAATQAPLAAMGGPISVGASAAGEGFLSADIDELRISTAARSPAWLALMAANQGPDEPLLAYGGDQTQEGQAESGGHATYMAVVIKNVTLDAWVVIVILAIMGVFSILVMFGKFAVLVRMRNHTDRFLEEYQRLGMSERGGGDAEAPPESADGAAHPATASRREKLFSLEDEQEEEGYTASPLYRVYHQGISEIRSRLGSAVGADAAGLDERSINAIRATLDAVMVRERQRLNAKMVLLTIAISGGPFLGLLGTVIGVMITFAAIAATGDVNINSIAPGMAAALLATTAGLGVAIPALFGYNYLSTRIRELLSDMQVFADEFIAKVHEVYGQ